MKIKKDKTITLRLTAREHDELSSKAKELNLSISEYVRLALTDDQRVIDKLKRKEIKTLYKKVYTTEKAIKSSNKAYFKAIEELLEAKQRELIALLTNEISAL